jgi:hypothetical protein
MPGREQAVCHAVTPRNTAKTRTLPRARLCHAVYAARRMSRFLLRFASALPVLALLACKLGRDNEQTDRVLPTPEPASTTPPTRPAQPETQPKERPKEPTPREPSLPSPATPVPAPAPKPTTTTTPTATATADAAAPTPTATADAAAPAPGADKVTQCATRCQASLSGCLAKVPLDAGVPSLDSMSACKKEFEDCRTACTP